MASGDLIARAEWYYQVCFEGKIQEGLLSAAAPVTGLSGKSAVSQTPRAGRRAHRAETGVPASWREPAEEVKSQCLDNVSWIRAGTFRSCSSF